MRKLVCLIFCLFVIVSLSTVCFAETITKTDQKIMYENNYVSITEPIVNIDGSLYVPIRTFCEEIGYTVDWTRESITIKKDTEEFLILEKSYTYVENKAYIGLRALGKLLNKPVDYDNNTRTKAIETGIGYKELYKYFDNEITLDEAIDLIKKNSRNFAKRQYTFFNHQMDVKWFDVNFDNFQETVEEVYNYIVKSE